MTQPVPGQSPVMLFLSRRFVISSLALRSISLDDLGDLHFQLDNSLKTTQFEPE